MELARLRRRVATLRGRAGRVRGRPAPRRRSRRLAGRARALTRCRCDAIRGLAATARPLGHDRDRGRIHAHAAPSRLGRCGARRLGRRGRPARDAGVEWRGRARRALPPPRHPPDRRARRLRRPAGALAPSPRARARSGARSHSPGGRRPGRGTVAGGAHAGPGRDASRGRGERGRRASFSGVRSCAGPRPTRLGRDRCPAAGLGREGPGRASARTRAAGCGGGAAEPECPVSAPAAVGAAAGTHAADGSADSSRPACPGAAPARAGPGALHRSARCFRTRLEAGRQRRRARAGRRAHGRRRDACPRPARGGSRGLVAPPVRGSESAGRRSYDGRRCRLRRSS
jgi:hypothetical protein